jgi:hypothetical protein
MLTEERKNIIRGQVRSEKGWVPIEEKIRTESLRRKKIETGLVFFQGEWIAIEEKIARVAPATFSPPQAQQPVVVNKTVNKQTYNVYNDNRTMNENIHEHRHVHVDPAQLGTMAGGALDSDAPRNKAIPFDKKKQIGRTPGPARELPPPGLAGR